MPLQPSIKLGSLAALLAACGAPDLAPPRGGTSSAATAPSPPSPCDRARRARARVDGLLAKGKLDRVVRVLAHADGLCPASVDESLAARVTTLAELGRVDEARAIADGIDARADAPNAAREASMRAREMLARADATPGPALVRAGLEARAKGDAAAAQRLFDRAVVALGHEAKTEVVLEPPAAWSDTLDATLGIALSPDGETLVVPSHGGLSIRRRRDAYRESERLEPPSADVVEIAFSPDGATLAVGFRSGTVQLLDTSSWALDRAFSHPMAASTSPTPDALSDLAFSPDGKRLATSTSDGGFGGTVMVWDPATGKLVRAMEGKGSGPGAIAFTPDGKTIEAMTWQEGMRTWNVATGAASSAPLSEKIDAENARVDAVLAKAGATGTRDLFAFGAGERALAVRSNGVDVRVFDVARAKELGALKTSAGATQIELSPDGALLFAYAEQATEVFDVSRGARLAVLPAHAGAPTYTPDGALAIVSAFDGARILDRATGAVTDLGRPNADDGRATGIGVSGDGRFIAFGSGSLAYRQLDARPPATVRTTVPAQAVASGFAFAPGGVRYAMTNMNVFALFDVAQGELKVLDTPRFPEVAAFSPDGARVAIGGSSSAEVRDGRTWDLLGSFDTADAWVRSVSFSPDGRLLAVGTDDGVTLYDAVSRERRRAFAGVEAVFSPVGGVLAIATEHGLSIQNVETGLEQRGFDAEGAPRGLVFAPDGRHVAARLPGAAWGVWSVTGAKGSARFPAAGEVGGVAFAPDGEVVIVSDDALRVRTIRGEPLVDVHALDRRDAGYVIASGDALVLELLGPDLESARAAFTCRVRDAVYPLEVCGERYQAADADDASPRGVLARALAGDTSYLEP